ncbi:mechanosensitive ion channel family protein [Enterovibrio sp. ZSDZ35]|uniref:Small-conductance mechanosensitive channel n=1 Tax=Enterovibrio qingdaonensis TaxID=2899818 RepID=A0ABT5QNP7_9GAMM|nr:mechanosensitive ion channel family protein [Enterovibrio sp. ZSDZ35]MDD1781906.1 mechanosensitive ion channel family protein [Enterovibrio sp. ZSDZ35]
MSRSNIIPSIIFFLLFSVAPTIMANPENTEPSIGETEVLLEAIREKYDVMEALSEKSESIEGEAFLKNYVRMREVNTELRELISHAIKHRILSDMIIVETIAIQREDAAFGFSEIPLTLNEIAQAIYDSDSREKLKLLGEYRDFIEQLDLLYKEELKNILWLEAIDINVDEEKSWFKEKISDRLIQIEETIDYLKKSQTLNHYFETASQGKDRSVAEIDSLTNEKRLEFNAASLLNMITLAKEYNIDTSGYQVLHFETTGVIDSGILEREAIFKLMTLWKEKALTLISKKLPYLIIQLIMLTIISLVTFQLYKSARYFSNRIVTSNTLDMPKLMQDFLTQLAGRVVIILGVIFAISQLGFNVMPILTGFGIASIIIGFALQDVLANFASGIMLLIYRPFDVSDYVMAGGVEGKVSHMSLVNATIRTFDNQIIIIPNQKIWSNVIKNMTHEKIRRIDMIFSAGYGDSISLVEETLKDVVTKHPDILRSPEPIIKLEKLSDSSVDFIVRPWVRTEHYWDVMWDVTKEVKIQFEEKGISIPFPQREITIRQESSDQAPQ